MKETNFNTQKVGCDRILDAICGFVRAKSVGLYKKSHGLLNCFWWLADYDCKCELNVAILR